MLGWLLLLAAVSAGAQTPGIEGAWHGALEVGSVRLRLVLRITDESALAAKLDSPEQGVVGLPATILTRAGAAVRLEFVSLGAIYEGKLNRDATEMAGEWRQGRVALPLVFRRSLAQRGRPQDPKRPYPYRDEEVAYESQRPAVRIAGTLTLPPQKRPAPAVLLLAGPGQADRDATIAGHRPSLVLADHLARQGFVVLRFDQRAGSADDLVPDALAGVEFLRARKEINPKQIVVAALGQAGLTAVTAHLKLSDRISYLVLLGAPVEAAQAGQIKRPVLAMWGERDGEVPAARHLPVLAAALEAAGNRDYSIVKLPGLNHLFQTCQSCEPAEYGRLDETFAPVALNLISTWIARHTR